MKQLLPILLCYVLMTSQVLAISGGPVIGGSSLNPIGIYSGVIIVNTVKRFNNDPATGAPIIDPNTGQNSYKVDTSTVSLGLFSLGVPSTNAATGAFIQFVNGDVFIGSIVASVQPDSGALLGVIEGSSSYSVTATSVSSGITYVLTSSVQNRAAGKINARITGTRSGSLASARINGMANLIVNSGGERVRNSGDAVGTGRGPLVQNYALDCTVTGFRQSTVYSAVNSLSLNTVGTGS